MLEAKVTGLSGYFSVAYAARLLGISTAALYKRLQRGKVPVLRINRTVLVRWADVRADGAELRSGM